MSHNILGHEGMFSRDGEAAVFALIVFAFDLIHVALTSFNQRKERQSSQQSQEGSDTQGSSGLVTLKSTNLFLKFLLFPMR